MTTPGRYLCSAAATERGDQPFGTASRVARWLLVEAPGPWGPRALPQNRELDEAVLVDVQHRAKQAHARTLLIRRPGSRSFHTEGHREVVAAQSVAGQEFLVRRSVTDVELAALELPFDGALDGWEPDDSLIAVCTHGSHDACCAIRGRPVAAALAAAFPRQTWEVSHVGGDRFAANVIVLPEGHYLGQVVPDRAVSAVTSLLKGERPDPFYRGRSCWPTPVQAAQSLVARELGIAALDELVPIAVDKREGHAWFVRLARPGSPDLAVEVQQQFTEETAKLTCHAPHANRVPSWHLLSIGAS